MRAAPQQPPIAPRTLLADLAAQLRSASAGPHGDPFSLGTQLGASDATPHAFGLFITDALYQHSGGSAKFAAASPSSSSTTTSARTPGAALRGRRRPTFPHCMQSEIANLSGSLTGPAPSSSAPPPTARATRGNFVGLGTVDGMRNCSRRALTGRSTTPPRLRGQRGRWPSVEPADDYTAISLLAFALAAR